MDGARRPTLCWLGAMLCVTAGFLTKWTAPAFFYLTLIPFLCLRGQLSHLWSRGHLLGALLAVLLVTGWALEVSRQVGWEVLLDTVRREAMQRVTPAGAGKGFPWKAALGFIPLVLMSNLPWSLPALLTLRRGFRASLSDRERTLWLFCHCWLWPNLLFWSMLSQHSLRYVLPVTPAFTLLGLLWWQRSLAHLSPRSLVRGAVLVCLGWVCVKAVCVEWVFPERTRHRQVRETAGRLRELVPSGEILYHGQLKDEGLMFYYARPTRKFPAPPGRYLLLTEAEWRQVAARPGLHLLADLRDQQRDAIYLVHAPAGALP